MQEKGRSYRLKEKILSVVVMPINQKKGVLKRRIILIPDITGHVL